MKKALKKKYVNLKLMINNKLIVSKSKKKNSY